MPDHARRLHAAMALAGLITDRSAPDFEALADRIQQPGYGARTLRKMVDPDEQGRTVQARDLPVLARALGVSEWFFSADFSADKPISDLERQVLALDERVTALADERQDLLAEMAELAADAVTRALESGELPSDEEGPSTGTPSEEQPGQ